MSNVKMTFVKTEVNQEENFLGWEKIEIIEFNYDGKGTALSKDYSDDGSFTFGEYSAEDPNGLRFLLWDECYKLV